MATVLTAELSMSVIRSKSGVNWLWFEGEALLISLIIGMLWRTSC